MFESKHAAPASVFRCLYLFFRSLVGEKYFSGLALSPLKPIHCILLSLVTSPFNFLGSVLSLKIVFIPRFVAKKELFWTVGPRSRYRKKLPAAAAN
jgi:hypothetical protein